MKHNHTHDPHAEKMGKGKVGIVGESHIWDGPLSQIGRLHGEGSSSGIYGMKLKLDGVYIPSFNKSFLHLSYFFIFSFSILTNTYFFVVFVGRGKRIITFNQGGFKAQDVEPVCFVKTLLKHQFGRWASSMLF